MRPERSGTAGRASSRLRAASSLALLAVALWPAPGIAGLCDDRDNIVRQLAQTYDETPVAVGVTNGGGLVEVLATKDGATWTIVVTGPDGRTCVVAAGEGWRALPRVVPADPAT